MEIGFIGLGQMGMPIAANLIKAGFPVVVHNRSQGKVHEMVAIGGKAGTTPAATAGSVDVIMTCLVGAATMREVLAGPDGVLQTARPGLIVVDHSTIGPGPAREMADLCAAKGVTYLDAPVSGTGAVARNGQLTIMVGGDAQAFEKVLPIMQAAEKSIFHMGPVGSGNTTKLINNLLLNTNLAATMEALVLGASLGVDLDALYQAVTTASGGSTQWQKTTPNILRRDFTPSASIKGFVGGESNIRALIESSSAVAPMFAAACKLWEQALAEGQGAEDPTAAIKVLERMAGVEARGKEAPTA